VHIVKLAAVAKEQQCHIVLQCVASDCAKEQQCKCEMSNCAEEQQCKIVDDAAVPVRLSCKLMYATVLMSCTFSDYDSKSSWY